MRHLHVLPGASGLILLAATSLALAQTATQPPKSGDAGSSRSVTKATPSHNYATASGNPSQPKDNGTVPK